MVVANEIGIPYLWVDKYCIDQSNTDEKHSLIRQMDKIYRGAELTIVATAGQDAELGLPGVSGLARPPQRFLTIGGQRYSVFPDLTERVRKSRWSTRGWTYQEGLLSRRRLVFTEFQVYFQCMETHHWEGLDLPLRPPEIKRMGFYRVFPEDGIGSHSGDIAKRLNEYASRQLTFDSDSLNAFLGILRSSQQKGVYHVWGIPFLAAPGASNKNMERSFANALGWSTRVPGNSTRRLGFPSWSWAGWTHLDNLTVPWVHGLDNLVESMRETRTTAEVHVALSGFFPLKSAAKTVSDYVSKIRADDDFSRYSQTICIAGSTSRCTVHNPWEVSIRDGLPGYLTGFACVPTVRMMGVPETSYSLLQDKEFAILYLGCQIRSNIVFSFLILDVEPGFSSTLRSCRAGTLTVVVPSWELVSSVGDSERGNWIDEERFFVEKWRRESFLLS